LLQGEERYGFELVKAHGEVDDLVTTEGTIYPLPARETGMANVQNEPDGLIGAPPRNRAREVIALLLLLFGGFVIFAWFIGVYLLWTSDRWKVAEKLLGTLVWPFGFIGAIALLRIPVTLPTWLEIVVGAVILFAPLAAVGVLLKNAQPGRATA
jgi:hypothetical protein